MVVGAESQAKCTQTSPNKQDLSSNNGNHCEEQGDLRPEPDGRPVVDVLQMDDGGKGDVSPDVTDKMPECRGDDGCAKIKQQDGCEIREEEELVERGKDVLPAGVVG